MGVRFVIFNFFYWLGFYSFVFGLVGEFMFEELFFFFGGYLVLFGGVFLF